ncbi:MAG TPA: hypothetical protein VGG29_03465 [Caulobacteraceae bacterium]|jgi:hypothetical protein
MALTVPPADRQAADDAAGRAKVGIQDHDHSEDELNGRVRVVEEASEHVKREYDIGVIIRP